MSLDSDLLRDCGDVVPEDLALMCKSDFEKEMFKLAVASQRKAGADETAATVAKSTETVATVAETTKLVDLLRVGAKDGVPAGTPLSQRLMRTLTPEEKEAYRALGKGHAAKAAWRKKWAEKRYGDLVKTMTEKEAWSTTNIENGTYLSMSRIIQEEGGNDATYEDVEVSKMYVLRCVLLGGDWVQWNAMTGRYDFLYLQNSKREQFVRSWELMKQSKRKYKLEPERSSNSKAVCASVAAAAALPDLGGLKAELEKAAIAAFADSGGNKPEPEAAGANSADSGGSKVDLTAASANSADLGGTDPELEAASAASADSGGSKAVRSNSDPTPIKLQAAGANSADSAGSEATLGAASAPSADSGGNAAMLGAASATSAGGSKRAPEPAEHASSSQSADSDGTKKQKLMQSAETTRENHMKIMGRAWHMVVYIEKSPAWAWAKTPYLDHLNELINAVCREESKLTPFAHAFLLGCSADSQRASELISNLEQTRIGLRKLGAVMEQITAEHATRLSQSATDSQPS